MSVREDPDELGYVLSRSEAQEDVMAAFEFEGPEWPLSARERQHIAAAASAEHRHAPFHAEQHRNIAGYSNKIDPGWG